MIKWKYAFAQLFIMVVMFFVGYVAKENHDAGCNEKFLEYTAMKMQKNCKPQMPVLETLSLGECVDPFYEFGADTPELRLFIKAAVPYAKFCEKYSAK